MGEESIGTANTAPAPTSAGTATEVRPETSQAGEGGAPATQAKPEAGTAAEGFFVGTYKTKEDAEKGMTEKDETINRLKSDRSRYEMSLQQLSPYFEYDMTGNVVGLKSQGGAAQQALTDGQLAEALIDPARSSEAVNYLKGQVAKEVRGEVSLMQRTQVAEGETYKTFPELRDPNSEMFKETQMEYLNYSPQVRAANPELVLTAAKAAYANLMQRKLPQMQQDFENRGRTAAYQTRLEKGGSGVATGQGVPSGTEVPISAAELRAAEKLGISEDKLRARKQARMQRAAEGGARI